MYSGDDFYTCLTMEKRGENVMEFQLAADTSSSYNQSLCQSDKTFAQESWVTQGSKFFYISFYNCFSIAINISDWFLKESLSTRKRRAPYRESTPALSRMLSVYAPRCIRTAVTLRGCFTASLAVIITAKFTTVIIFNIELFKPLYILQRHFLVNTSEREYRCLGMFADRGLTYTYTERRVHNGDVLSYECFVGVIINDGELYIKEAGEHCQRDAEPLRLGMKVTRQGASFLL